MTRALIYLTASVLLAAPAAAQTNLERANLRRESVTNRFWIIEVAAPGDSMIGTIRAVDDNEIEVAVGSGIRRVGFNEVNRIYREGDSVKDGALIGMAVLGTWCALVCGEGLDSSGKAVAILLNGAFGAGIGGALDLAHTGTTTIYRRRPTVRVAPVVAPSGAGMRATLTW